MIEETLFRTEEPLELDEAQEGHGLIAAASREGSPDADAVPRPARPKLQHTRRQSSFAQSRPNGAPRTPNRVRFEVDDRLEACASVGDHDARNGWLEEEDYLSNGHIGARRGHYGQTAPLLTGIEAPAVTVAESDFQPEDLLESSRPKSSMSSAFMNMANSIM